MLIQLLTSLSIYFFLNALYMRSFASFTRILSKTRRLEDVIEVSFLIILGLAACLGGLDSLLLITILMFIFMLIRGLFFNFWHTYLVFSFTVAFTFFTINDFVLFWFNQKYHYELTLLILVVISLALKIKRTGIRISYSTNFFTSPLWSNRLTVIIIFLGVGLQFLAKNNVAALIELILLMSLQAILIAKNLKFRKLLNELNQPLTPEEEKRIKEIVKRFENNDD